MTRSPRARSAPERQAASWSPESTDCLLCGTDEHARPIYSHRRDRYLQRIAIRYRCRWVMCMRCGLLYQNPRPGPECMSTIYASTYWSGSPSREHLSRKEQDAEGRYAWITRVLGAKPARPRVLDVGCSEGSLLAIFKGHGWEAYGVEPSASFARWGREHHGLRIHIGSFDGTCYPESHFELIVLSHLLEHIHDPHAFMALVRDRMAPSGAVFVEVPDLTRLDGDIAGYLYGAPHLYGFSPQTLRTFLGRVGFRVVEMASAATGIRALAEQGMVETIEETQPDARDAYRSFRRRLRWHRARFFLARGWKDALKWSLIDVLGAERTEALLRPLRKLRRR